MRSIAILSSLALATLLASVIACSGSTNDTGFGGSSSGGGSGSSSSGGGSNSSGGGSSSGNSSGGSSSGSFGSSSGGPTDAGGDMVVITTKTTVYAHTDDTLYSVDPMSKTVTQIGVMSGQGTNAVTDLAVDANGDVYVNTESTLYKATLPSSPGAVTLTQIAPITVPSSTTKVYFYALAFAPAGALDPNNETLVGGDSTGSLYSINTTSGAATNLGNFGNDASGACGMSACTFELSGDIVFYSDSSNKPTGLATIRSCPTGKSSGCSADWLAGVNMANLKQAYTSGTPATSLLAGIYGGNGAQLGSGTGFHDVFGLGAWDSTVFGFTRHMTSQSPSLITIDPTSGAGTLMGSPFSFTNGWSGAGVTTKVTIMVPPPPPPPPGNQ